MKKKKQRLLAIILAIFLVCDLFPTNLLPKMGIQVANAAVSNANTEDVSRAEWIQKLVELFDMTVMEENLPDNYFSDVEDSAEYYRDILVATEFGVIDIEEGGKFEPDLPVTREFAAHTLNFCLGYKLEESVSYSFLDIKDIAYAEDAQIAVNRGWFTLSAGKFLPNEKINRVEYEAIITDVQNVTETFDVDDTYDSQYVFANGIIELPEWEDTEVKDDGTVIINNASKSIKNGNTFVIYQGGLPQAYKAVKVAESDSQQTITTEYIDINTILTSVDAQGTTDVDLSLATPVGEDTTISYIVGGTEALNYEDGQAYSREALARIKGNIKVGTIKISKKISLGSGVSTDVNLTFSNATLEYNLNTNLSNIKAKAVLKGTAKITASANCNAMGLMGLNNVDFVTIPVAGIGEFKISSDIALSGSITVVYTTDVGIGVDYSIKDGVRYVKDFNQREFSVDSEITAKIGMSASMSLITMPVLRGSLIAKIGINMKNSSHTYNDGNVPAVCSDINAYLYANLSTKLSLDLFVKKIDMVNQSIDIFNQTNSPLRIAIHYEDGTRVFRCSRNPQQYITPIGSWYGGYGSRYLTDESGRMVPVFKYTVSTDEKNNEVATITGYTGSVSTLIIPDTIDGYKVVGIGNNAFENNKQLCTVVIPDSVTTIGNKAFYNCSNLEDVTLSKKLVSLGGYGFGNCIALKEITIPKTLESAYGSFEGCSSLEIINFEEGILKIVSGIFKNCTGLRSVTIPNTVTAIGSNAFYGCVNLEKIILSDSVTSIECYAFAYCIKLLQVILPKNLKTLGAEAFGNCTQLNNIIIPKSLESVSLYDGRGWGGGPFTGCSALKDVEIEDGTSYLTDNLFSGCVGIEKVIIPITVTTIGNSTFKSCSNLKEVVMQNTVTRIGHHAFEGCEKLTNINLSKNLKSIGAEAFCSCKTLSSINIPKKLEQVDLYDGYGWRGGPFKDCSNLKEIEFETGIEKIINSLFDNCSGIEKIVIPDTVTEIGSSAFYNCKALKDVTIPDGVTTIGNTVFKSCSSLKSIELPDSITSIGDSVFSDCTSLSIIKLSKKTNRISTKMFYNCTSLESISVPEAVTNIRQSAFENSGLKEIIVPDSVELIENYTFKNTPLKKIRIGINVQEIRAEAFKDCALLKEIVIPNSVRALGNSVFMNCEELSKVILGNGIETIPSYAFHQCPKLEEIVIPYNVKTIMNNAFSNCVRFSKITIPQVTEKIDTSIFSYPDNVTIYGVKGSYAETFAKENEITFVINGTKATNVTLNKSSVLLKRGTSQQLSLTVVPINFTDKVTWKSSNENVAIVTENGRITAKDYGTSVITVTVGNLTSSCKVTVSANTILLDKVTNIEVECPEGSISNNISLQTKQLTEADQEYGKITDKIVDAGISPSNVKFDAYDISLVSEAGNTVQPTKAVKVHVPCTDGYKGENGKVYRVNENGTFTDMKAVYEDGYLIFETNYLSTYIITETELVTYPDVILGDVNRDGEVDIKDSALIKRYLAGWEVDIDLEPADMDGDKDVTIKDSALVKRQLAGW